MQYFTIHFNICLIALLTGGTAAAQSDPFEDYETGRDRPRQASKPADTGTQVVVVDAPRLRPDQGRWVAGLDSTFSWTTVSNDVSGGGSATNTNLFLRISPTVGYFLFDKVEIGGSLGYLSQSTTRRGGGTATENNGLLTVHGRYYAQMSQRFAIVPSVALGGYVGNTKQPATVMVDGVPREIDEDASTLGFVGAIELAAAYQLTTDLLLRAGLAFTGVVGRQAIGSTDESLSVRTMNTGLSLGLAYSW